MSDYDYHRRYFGLIVEVPEACIIPRGYGVAWRDFMRGRAICAPMPLNWLLAVWQWLAYALRFPRILKGPDRHASEMRAENRRLLREIDELRERAMFDQANLERASEGYNRYQRALRKLIDNDIDRERELIRDEQRVEVSTHEDLARGVRKFLVNGREVEEPDVHGPAVPRVSEAKRSNS